MNDILQLSLIFLLIILNILLHELAHYLTAKHYGYEARFIWLKNKKEESKLIRAMNFFLPFPAVKIKKIRSLEHLKWIMYIPIIPTFITFLLINFLISIDYKLDILYFILLSVNMAIFFTLIACYGDMRTVRKYNRIAKNIHNWFVYIDTLGEL